jgi:hypothetical protein
MSQQTLDHIKRPHRTAFVLCSRRTDSVQCNSGTASIEPLSFLRLVLTGYELAGDIFKAGVWVGVLLLVGVIGLGVWMFPELSSSVGQQGALLIESGWLALKEAGDFYVPAGSKLEHSKPLNPWRATV